MHTTPDSHWVRSAAPALGDDSHWVRDAHWRDAHWR
jgi:hypothetical protein